MLDLFSGIGGFSLAAEWTGRIRTVAFCEIEPFCQKVLRKHWPDVPIFSDIKELRGEDIGTVDILTGGFPCQPFSCAGKQRGKEDDRYLWPEMFRVIQETKPTWVIGENVTGLINMALEDCFLDLEAEGYEVQPLIIPACAVNAPHRRDRVWIVGYSKGISQRPRLRQGKQAEQRRGRFGDSDSQGYIPNSDNRGGVMRGNRELPTAPCPERPGSHNGGRTPEYVTGEWWAVEPDVGRVVDGLPAGVHGYFDREPDTPRVATGIKNRVHRLKALGNSIVPQVVYPILQAITEIEQGVTGT